MLLGSKTSKSLLHFLSWLQVDCKLALVYLIRPHCLRQFARLFMRPEDCIRVLLFLWNFAVSHIVSHTVSPKFCVPPVINKLSVTLRVSFLCSACLIKLLSFIFLCWILDTFGLGTCDMQLNCIWQLFDWQAFQKVSFGQSNDRQCRFDIV